MPVCQWGAREYQNQKINTVSRRGETIVPGHVARRVARRPGSPRQGPAGDRAGSPVHELHDGWLLRPFLLQRVCVLCQAGAPGDEEQDNGKRPGSSISPGLLLASVLPSFARPQFVQHPSCTRIGRCVRWRSESEFLSEPRNSYQITRSHVLMRIYTREIWF